MTKHHKWPAGAAVYKHQPETRVCRKISLGAAGSMAKKLFKEELVWCNKLRTFYTKEKSQHCQYPAFLLKKELKIIEENSVLVQYEDNDELELIPFSILNKNYERIFFS